MQPENSVSSDHNPGLSVRSTICGRQLRQHGQPPDDRTFLFADHRTRDHEWRGPAVIEIAGSRIARSAGANGRHPSRDLIRFVRSRESTDRGALGIERLPSAAWPHFHPPLKPSRYGSSTEQSSSVPMNVCGAFVHQPGTVKVASTDALEYEGPR